MKLIPKAETVKRFREATGMGWMESKLFFVGRSAELCERILRAHQEQGGGILHDLMKMIQSSSSGLRSSEKQRSRITGPGLPSTMKSFAIWAAN
jgi:hypothetical protein